MALVAAFFVGRRSDEIKLFASSWWEVTRVQLGADAKPGYDVICWPPGSITINEDVPIQAVVVNDPDIAEAILSAPRQLRVSPKSNGETFITYTMSGGRYTTGKLRFKPEAGELPDWTLSRQ
jgi:hypothetical protein